jgi:TolA-binding protein
MAHFHIAECLLHMGKEEDAIKKYEEVIRSFPQSDPAKWAKEDLNTLKKHPELMTQGMKRGTSK